MPVCSHEGTPTCTLTENLFDDEMAQGEGEETVWRVGKWRAEEENDLVTAYGVSHSWPGLGRTVLADHYRRSRAVFVPEKKAICSTSARARTLPRRRTVWFEAGGSPTG